MEQIIRSLLRSLFQDHTPGSYLLGLLLGLGIIVYILYTLQTGVHSCEVGTPVYLPRA